MANRLASRRQIIDLIEKQCSSVCLLKAADLARASSHKRPFLVPEQEEESDCEHHIRSVLPSRRAVNRKQRRKLDDKSRREPPARFYWLCVPAFWPTAQSFQGAYRTLLPLLSHSFSPQLHPIRISKLLLHSVYAIGLSARIYDMCICDSDLVGE
jgi:hypothetical protein